jgi:hypothetical protein
MRRSAILLSPFFLAVSLAAQTVQVARPSDLLVAPGGRSIGSVQAGVALRQGARRAGATTVTLEGWVESAKVAGRRDSFPQSIAAGGTVRVRAGAAGDARVVGALVGGAGIRVLERRGPWSRIRRTGWVPASALATGTRSTTAATADAGRPSAEAAAEAEEPARPGTLGAVRAPKRASLHAAPLAADDAEPVATLPAGASMVEVARDRGWVKVRVEGWIPETELVPADSSFTEGLRAVDLRVDAARVRGRVVRWDVQSISLQKADPLRRGLEPDEPYLLALGPVGENVVLYLAVPPALLAEARALPPMSDLRITARVRLGRSEPTGAPILDLLTLTRR